MRIVLSFLNYRTAIVPRPQNSSRKMGHAKVLFYAAMALTVGLLWNETAWAKLTLQTLPNAENPKQIIVDNDSLTFSLSLDWQLSVTSLLYKAKNIQMIQADRPMPLVQIDNPWILHSVGFAMRTARVRQTPDSLLISIAAKSNYVENPFQLFIRLGFSENAQIAVRIWLENHYQADLTDIYRRGKAGVTPGLPWLATMDPDPGGRRRILYPISENWDAKASYDNSFVLEEFRDKYIDALEPTEDVYPKPTRKPVVMRFYHQPSVPLILEYPDLNMGVFIFKQDTNMEWEFDNIRAALWPHQRMAIEAGGSRLIFDGVIRIFVGDWHTGFHWFRERIRKDFNFTYYHRERFAPYKKDFLAFHSFIFNHELYDPVNNRYRIREFLQQAKRDYDGFDQFYFWHAYPRVGVDPRDQFDLFYDLPGGIEGLKNLVLTADSMGTHVYLAYNPWDVIGRKKDMYGEMAKIVGATHADGLLLDTMGKSDSDFRTQIDLYNPDAQFVTEGRPDLDGLVVTTSSWDHLLTEQSMPCVDLLRFIIPEHRVFQINRWDRDRLPLIKKALFNATGYTVWTDVFGEINLQTWDEKIVLSRYHRAMHDFAHVLNTSTCEPLINTFLPALYVNGFFSDDMHFYTLYHDFHNFVSRHKENRIIGPLFHVNLPESWHMVDVWNKRPVEIHEQDGLQTAFLPNEMPEDVGCLVAMPRQISINQNNQTWTAIVEDDGTGVLELIGVDSGMRNQTVIEGGAKAGLVFDRTTANPTQAGYVMVQYRNADKEVKDVAIVQVGF